MPVAYIIVLIFSSIAGVTSQLLFKNSTLKLGIAPGDPSNYLHFFAQLLLMPRFVAALLLYGASFVLWIFLLSRNSLSLLYPVGLAINIIFTIMLSRMVLGESIGALQLFGVGIIIIGMFLVLR